MLRRYLSAIYCDDVRQELGNKFSYMGVYGPSLLLPGFPVTLPKLCVVLSAVSSMAEPIKSLTFKIMLDKDVIAEVPISQERLDSPVISGANVEDPNSRCIVHGLIYTIAPFSIERSATLRVRAVTENGELQAPGLTIQQAPPD